MRQQPAACLLTPSTPSRRPSHPNPCLLPAHALPCPHPEMPAGYPENDTVAEILGARRYLSDKCGIPADQIRGFRSPYLVTNPVVRKVGSEAAGLPGLHRGSSIRLTEPGFSWDAWHG